jgi:hypothetical protein
MPRTKIRTTVLALVATLSLAGASLVPAAAQAQWHTYCTAGHCITHTNFTIGGVSPCAAIEAGYGKAYDGLLEALQKEKELPDRVHPEMTPAEAQAAVEDAEAQVHLASIASFEWGCSVTSQATSAPVAKAPVHAVGAVKAKASSSSHRAKTRVASASAR